MPQSGEQSVHSDEASSLRRVLEQASPDTTFSYRTELLSDDDSHKGRKGKAAQKATSHKRHRTRNRKDRDDTHPDLTRQLARLLDARQGTLQLNGLLGRVSERLDQESRRAMEAETRAREAEAQLIALQAIRHTTQVDAAREQETLRAYQAQLEVARNEILRAQKELDSMAAEKHRAEEEAARERSKARQMAKEVEIQRAIELGREQGKRQGFVDGRKEGWHMGTKRALKEAYGQLLIDNDGDSVSSGSTSTPPITSSGQQPPFTSFGSTATQGNPIIVMPTPEPAPAASSGSKAATSQATHKRSGSLTQSSKSRIRVNSDAKPPAATTESFLDPIMSPRDTASPRPPPTSPRVTASPRPPAMSPRLASPRLPVSRPPSVSGNTLGRPEQMGRPSSTRLSPSPSRDQITPTPIQNRPVSPRHSPISPLPGGYIPLQKDGRVFLPPPHELDPPPPSPHTPNTPLPELRPFQGPSLQPPNATVNATPSITVQQPTPPEPPMTMPEPQLMPVPDTAPVTENNFRPNKPREAVTRPGASPPLPPLPTQAGIADRPSKGKQRQRAGPRRAGPGLHPPGRSSPSDTSTEYSQFDIVEQPAHPSMGYSNGSQLSVILEGGSSVAESPSPEVTRITPLRATPINEGLRSTSQGSQPQGILDDPREYGDFSEQTLTPIQLAERRLLAEQLRRTPPGETNTRNNSRVIRDDVSIKSSTSRASAPRRRPHPKMPERLAASRDVEALEKQAEMYDAFGTGQRFPYFDDQSTPSPEEVIPTRTPDIRKGHRRAASSGTVPEITIQPPSRTPSSPGSRLSLSGNLSPRAAPAPMPEPSIPSRRHSMQGTPRTPSRVPLPHSTVQMPVSLGNAAPDLSFAQGGTQGYPMTPSRVPLPQTTVQVPVSLGDQSGGFEFPPGFVPLSGPPSIMGGSIPAQRSHSVHGDSIEVTRPPSRRGHSPVQEHPTTPSRVPLPQTAAQIPVSLDNSQDGPFGLPPGFVPIRGPPEVLESFNSALSSKTPKTPGTSAPKLTEKTPHLSASNVPPQSQQRYSFRGATPSGVPLPLSTGTTTWGLPDTTTMAPRTGRSAAQDLPRFGGNMTNSSAAPLGGNPSRFPPPSPANMPLPASVAGTPWSGWGGNSLAAGVTPGPGRPMNLYS